eukprot:gb/GFBE01074421.1/.p1 GENE.gb/GFBE01074421.1/~~gb/GFBE01074421.1/.p1  ORF type:complete len:200 (+),score=34.98 gb/GFBE01074421.1/:1-600(+)
MDTAREVNFSARNASLRDDEAEQSQLLDDCSQLQLEDREGTAAPLPAEFLCDEADEDAYYSEIGRRSWQVIKRVFIGSAALVVVLILLAFKHDSWPRWHSKGHDVVKMQASLSGEKVCGAIYCSLAGSCCKAAEGLCCGEGAQCCSNGIDAECCETGSICCNGACCSAGSVCCRGICGAPGAECVNGIVLSGFLPKASA